MIEIPLAKSGYNKSSFWAQHIFKTVDDALCTTLHRAKTLKRGVEQADITGNYSQPANGAADIISCNHSYIPKSFSAFS